MPFKICHRRGGEVFEGRLGQLGKNASYLRWEWDADGGGNEIILSDRGGGGGGKRLADQGV